MSVTGGYTPGTTDLYEPPLTVTGTDPQSGATTPTDTGSGSGGASQTKDAAKGEASALGSSAAERAKDVAATGKDQARDVAQETKRQAQGLANQAKTQVNDQVAVQRDRLVDTLRQLGDELGQMADRSDVDGLGAQLARQVSSRTHEVAGFFEGRQAGDIGTSVRDFARSRPGTFLLGAALAGVVVGRLTRSEIAVHREGSSNGSDGYGYGYGTSTGVGYTPGTSYAATGGYTGGTDTGYAEGSYAGSGYAEQPDYQAGTTYPVAETAYPADTAYGEGTAYPTTAASEDPLLEPGYGTGTGTASPSDRERS